MISCNPVRIDEDGRSAVASVLDSGLVARGPSLARLEESFRGMTGAEHAVPVANGTAALLLAGMAIGLHAGDTVLVPALSFAATANAFLALGCQVVAVDVGLRSHNVDAGALGAALDAYPGARALVVVDLFGSTVGTDAAISLARRRGLAVIEDAAQAVGAHTEDGAPIGRRSDATTFSLYATKNVFAGEGGVVVSPHGDVARRVRSLSDHETVELNGRRLVGLNYRMNELGAALAVSQMPKLASFVRLRRERARRLADACRTSWQGRVAVPEEAWHADDLDAPRHVFHQFTVQASDEATRASLQERLRVAGVETRRFYPYTLASLPGVTASHVPTGERAASCCFSLPIAHLLTDAEFEGVLAAVGACGLPG